MGTDIKTFVEQQDANESWHMIVHDEFTNWSRSPFDWREYPMFDALAGARTSMGKAFDPDSKFMMQPVVPPRGLPHNVSRVVGWAHEEELDWAHTESWLLVSELLLFWESGLFDGLSDAFFADLEVLAELDKKRPTRVVFWFAS